MPQSLPQGLPQAGNDDPFPDDRSLADDLRGLVDEGRALAEAEFAYGKALAAHAGRGIRDIAVFALLAAALVFFALMALTVGAIVALTPLLTAWGATAAVFGAMLVLAAICGAIASARWKRLNRTLAQSETAS